MRTMIFVAAALLCPPLMGTPGASQAAVEHGFLKKKLGTDVHACSSCLQIMSLQATRQGCAPVAKQGGCAHRMLIEKTDHAERAHIQPDIVRSRFGSSLDTLVRY